MRQQAIHIVIDLTGGNASSNGGNGGVTVYLYRN